MRTAEQRARAAELARAWRALNPEKVREQNAKQRDRQKAWVRANPERRREHQRAYDRSRGPDYIAFNNHRQRARRFGGLDVGVRPERWRVIFEYFDGRCAYCLGAADSRDHIMPLSRGGADEESNVVPCCGRCNSSKGTKSLLEWIR